MSSSRVTRSIGGTAVAALVLTAAPAIVGSQAAMAADCTQPEYEGSVATSTSLSLTRAIGGYGATNRATVVVSSGAGTPVGQVRIVVDGSTRATFTLANGRGSALLPRNLGSRATHSVQAQMVGNNCFKTSSQTKFYTVTKASTSTSTRVLKPRKGVYRARVLASTGVTVGGGRVHFVVRRNGIKVASGLKRVRSGTVKVDLRNLSRGRYVVRATYLGSPNFKGSAKKKSFRVR
jgi:hypothetical protein